MTQRISISPDPPAQGTNATICYDFTDTNLTSVQLNLDWSPSSIPDSSVTVTPAHPCADVLMPAGATSLIISDGTGTSEDLAVAVTSR